MKKILLLLLVSLLYTHSYAWGIKNITVTSDSTVLIETDPGEFEDAYVDLSLKRQNDSNSDNGVTDTFYLNYLSIPAVWPGLKMLIKTKDDEIIELTCVHVTKDLKSYEITEEQIQKIISSGVSKLRYEGVFDFIDEPLNKDRFSPIIKDKYEAIKGVCLVKKYDDIYEDF